MDKEQPKASDQLPESSGSHLADELIVINEQNTRLEGLDTAVNNLHGTEVPTTTEGLTKAIVEATASDPEAAKAQLNALCTRRQVGSNYRGNIAETHVIDMTLIDLVSQGHIDAAKGLISSSPKEIETARNITAMQIKDPQKAAEVVATITKLHHEKQRALADILHANGVTPQRTDEIIATSPSPDSAAHVSPAFWESLNTMPDAARLEFWRYPSDIGKRAETITDLVNIGLGESALTFCTKLETITDSKKRTAYLQSAKSAVEKITTIPDPEVQRNALAEAADFADPEAAVEASTLIYGELSGRNIAEFSRLCPRSNDLVVFKPEEVPALAAVNQNAVSSKFIDAIAHKLHEAEDPITTVNGMIKALELISEHMGGDIGISGLVVDSPHPFESAKIITDPESLIADANLDLRFRLIEDIALSDSPSLISSRIEYTQAELTNREVNVSEMDYTTFISLSYLLTETPEGPEREKVIEKIANSWKLKTEYIAAYQDYLAPIRESGLATSANIELKLKLEDLPTWNKIIVEAGFSPAEASDLFDTWNYYAAFSKSQYDKPDKSDPKVSNFELNTIANDQLKIVTSQVEAVQGFVEAYGKDELRSIMDTFGIKNFSRYSKEQLHDQLTAWKAGEISYENIIIGATADWNGALDRIGSEFTTTLSGNAVFFEAGSATELSKVIVAVGNRERSQGRDPLQTNSAKNVIVHGHANPDGIALGIHKERLSVGEFEKAAKNRTKIDAEVNNYRRHLGSKFRIILQACSTAGAPTGERNIAQAISEDHDAEVAGSALTTQGAFIIEADGAVTFRTDTTDKTTPGTVYDGRE